MSQTTGGTAAAPHELSGPPDAPPAAPKTVRSMVVSLLLVLGVVGGLVLIVPRPNAVVVSTVDVRSAAQAAASDVPFVPVVPRALPAGWSPTSARVDEETGQVLTWRVGYVTPSGGYAGYMQAVRPPASWFKSQSADGRVTGTVEVSGRPWTVWEREDRSITMLVRPGPTVTTIVTGQAPMPELTTLAGALAVG